ncbi:MAG: outer membrane beta-barrel protein [bacterium]
MRKKMVGFIIAGMLVLVFGLASTPARAELSLGVVGGYYSPNFGKINDDYLAGLGTDLEFKAGAMYGLVLGYDLPARFGLRLEYNSFESKTSDEEQDFKLTVTPMMLSLIYGFSPAYIGAGVGLFSTEFKDTYGDSDSDSPTGLVLLGGFGFGDRPIFLNLEARYVVGTKPKLEDFGTEVDLSGLQLGLLAGLKI